MQIIAIRITKLLENVIYGDLLPTFIHSLTVISPVWVTFGYRFKITANARVRTPARPQ